MKLGFVLPEKLLGFPCVSLPSSLDFLAVNSRKTAVEEEEEEHQRKTLLAGALWQYGRDASI